MKLLPLLLVSVVVAGSLPLGAQSQRPNPKAMVSESNLTRGQGEMGDAWWTKVALPMMGNPKVDSISANKTSELVGNFHWAQGDSESIALSLLGNGIWKMAVKNLNVPLEPQTGRWIVRKDRIELWDKTFGDPSGDNNKLIGIVFFKKGRRYVFDEDANGGCVELKSAK